jgi:hypothetical protein
MAYTQLLVNPPASSSNADGQEIFALAGKQGDALVSDLHGKHFTANYRGKLFEASAAAVTVPVVAATLVSVFTLYNPVASGVNMELVEASLANVVATTVVDAAGWYYSTAALTALGTFTTKGTVQSLVAGNSPANQGLFYSAYTHSGTPVLVDIIGGYGAATSLVGVSKFYDGRLIIPPGIAMSLAMSTNAGTTSGITASVIWQESPI